jgi:RNA-directed DNA polymerase
MPAEGRGLGSEPTSKVERGRRLGNLATPISVQRLQTALHAKAKEEPEFRFHALYDKITGWTYLSMPMPVAAPTRAHRE